MKPYLILGFLVAAAGPALCQNGNFRSIGSGPWTTIGLWERDADGNGIYEDSPSSLTPSYLDGEIIIQNGHNVRVNTNLRIDETTVLPGGRISVLTTGLLTVEDGDGIDLENSGIVVSPSGNNLIFAQNAEYRHSINGGTIPLAAWQSGSTCRITGVTSMIPNNLNPTAGFQNVVWECAGQSAVIFLNNSLFNILGDLSILNTNGYRLYFTTSTASNPLSVGGDFIVSGNSRVIFTTTGNLAVNVGGNFGFFSSHPEGSALVASSGTVDLNVDGSLQMNAVGGLLTLSSGSGTANIDLLGNFSLDAGTFTETATGSGTINFLANGTQTVTNTGIIHNTATIDYHVGESSTLILSGESPLKGRSILVEGTIIVQSLDVAGAIVNNMSQGNIRTVTRTFSATASVIYGGSGLQYIGNGHPVSDVLTIIDNPSGVSFSGNATGNADSETLLIGGELQLLNGSNFIVRGNFSNNRTLRLLGGFYSDGGAFDFADNYSNLMIENVGDGIIPFSGTNSELKNLYINVPSGSLELANDILLTGSVVVDQGSLTVSSVNGFSVDGDVTINGMLVGSAVNLTGNFTNNGTVSGLNTLVLNGSQPQIIAGTNPIHVADLEIQNNSLPSSVINNGFIYVDGSVSLATGAVLDADGSLDNGYLVIESSTAGDGRIGELSGGAEILGSVTVQRRLPAADNANWYISSAITNAAVAQLQDDFEVTGYFTGTDYPCAGCDQPGASLKWYLESSKGEHSIGYQAMPQHGGSNEETLVPGRGYAAYIYNGEEETIIDLRGPLNQGTINYTVTHTASNPAVPSADGWNLIGNPFASPIQWGTTGWTRSGNIDPTVWVWDILGQTWRSYNYNDAGAQTLADGVIASGQGFWVYVHPGAANLSVTEAAKTSTPQGGTFYRKKTEQADGLRILVANDLSTDEVYIKVHEGATAAFDIGLDAFKPRAGHEQISMSVSSNVVEGAHYLAINESSLLEGHYDLNMSVKNHGEYQISTEEIGEKFKNFVLVDRYLGRSVSLTEAYSFVVTNDPKSIDNRFSIAIGEKVNFDEESIKLYHAYPNPVSTELFVDSHSGGILKVFWMNSLGQVISSKDVKNHEQVSFDVTGLPSAVYFLKVVTSDNKVYISKVIKP